MGANTRQDGIERFTVIPMTGPLASETARALAGELSDLAAEAFTGPPWNETSAQARQLADQMLADTAHPAFTLALAFAGRGPALAGFGYGLASGGGEPFKRCELVVLPAVRAQGVGRALLDAIVARLPPAGRLG